MSRVPRAAYVEQSVMTFIRTALAAKGFPAAQIEFRDAFEQRAFEDDRQLDKDYVALGFNFDLGGVPIEMGSSLRRYNHAIEVFVIALSADRGLALAYSIREAIDESEIVPLLDIMVTPAVQIDSLIVQQSKVERQVTADPLPWQQYAWLVTINVDDEYYAYAQVPGVVDGSLLTESGNVLATELGDLLLLEV